MTLGYSFFNQTGLDYYLEGSDEWETPGEDIDYDYDIDDRDLVKALEHELKLKDLAVKEQAIKIIEKITQCSEFNEEERKLLYEYDLNQEFKSNAELVDWAIQSILERGKEVTLYRILDLALGDIEYFGEYEEIYNLACNYFEDEAEKDFRDNY